jgi:chromate reductase, NAD(P)H dehydrogenase (quinone)
VIDEDLDATGRPVRHVLGVVGSLRRESYNRKLLRHAVTSAPARMRITVVDDIIRLPLFDEDLEVDGLPSEVTAAQSAIRTADGVLIATPEYNFGAPGVVKNFVDWASRPPRRGAFIGKPIMLMGASSGRTGGTVQCQGQLRVALAVLGAHVLPSPPVLLAEAADKFDGEVLTDEVAKQVTDLALTRFLELIDSLTLDPPR